MTADRRRNPRKNSIVQEYVLPDFSSSSKSQTGYIRSGPNAQVPDSVEEDEEEKNGAGEASSKPKPRKKAGEEDEQVLYMGNERFASSELLYHPSDIGIQQTGLPETIAYVIAQMPPELQGMFWAHIGVIGGLGNVEALGERL